MVNVPVATMVVFRKAKKSMMFLAAFFSMQYVYYLFNFPVEAMWFDRTARSTNQPYAQFLRDEFISKFPDSKKAADYKAIN